MKKSVLKSALGTALGTSLALMMAGPVSAATVNGGLTGGVLNTLEDQDREAFFDFGPNGTPDGVLGVGDVFVGFVRIDDFLPSNQPGNDQVYGVISNQIISVDANDPTILNLGVTTQVGLRLEDITGDANATGGLVAVYDSAVGIGNLITGPVGADLKANTDLISAQTLRLVAGLGTDPDSYLQVNNNAAFGAGVSTAALANVPTSVTLNSFTGGLEVLFNNTAFTYLDTVVTVDALGNQHFTQIGIGNGATRGAIGDGNEGIFTDGSGFGDFNQCIDPDTGGNLQCGFVTDADFFVNPVSEPGTLALFGAALFGLGVLRRRGAKA